MKAFRLLLLTVFTAGLLGVLSTPASALSPFLQVQNTTDMETGYGLGLKRKMNFTPILAVEARVSWFYTEGDGRYADLNTFPLELAGRVNLGIFYGGLGGGYYLFSGDDFRPDNSLGGFAFAGVEFGLFGLGAFAEARWLHLDPGEKHLDDVNRDLSGVGGNVGITLPIGK